MSYKALKDYLQSCPVRRSPAPSSTLYHFTSSPLPDREERKPRKTSLKQKIASWDLSGDKSLQNQTQELASSRPTLSAPIGSELESCRQDGALWERALVVGCPEEVEKRTEPRNSITCQKVDALRGVETGAFSSYATSQVDLNSKRRRSGPFSNGNWLGETPLASSVSIARQQMESMEEDEEDTQILPLGEEEELGRDSEAGLFAQPEPEGPFEPLVLWPSAGEDTSYGVGEERTIQVPSSINSRLLEHQRKGVQFLYNLYRKNEGGILGDDMGLGKTIQSIAFLAAILEKESEMNGTLQSISATKAGAPKRTCEKMVLIICPTSVLQNWEREFQTWGEFEVGIYHGLQRELVIMKVEAKEIEIVLTSHDTFRIHGDELCKIKWDSVIVDEAHRLKNERSQLYIMCSKLPTKRRYGLTGTVMQNKCMELFNVFDWAAPGSLGTRDHFREYYDRPITEGQRISAPKRFVLIAEDRKKHLFLVLRSYFLRRTKQETIGHLMKGKEDNVVFCPMSSIQKRVYKRVLQSPDYQALINKGLPCTCGSPLTRGECCYRIVPNGVIWSYLHKDSLDNGCDLCPYCLVLPCLTKLRQVSNHLELIKPNPKDDPEKQDKDHQFAQMAFGEDADQVGGLQQDQSFLGLSDAQHCGKMSALEKLLSSWITQGDKVLLFSDSVRMLDILEKFLIRKGYSFSRLDGSIPMSTRQSLVEDFNQSPSKQIFLISTRAGGLGLNLTSANRVVIFDPNWNPAHDLQAQDRSFRYGQIRHVTVFRLLAAGSLEELVYTRQIYKQQLFNITLAGASEKRYFEGVQGSKQHKGELFGVSNLFRDISEEVFAEDIIEKHEERLVRIQQSATLECPPCGALPDQFTGSEYAEEGDDHQGDLSCVEAEDSEIPQLAPKEQDHGDIPDERRTQMMVQKALTNAGVVYSHRNEDVVNLGPCVFKAPQGFAKRITNVQHKLNKQESKVQGKETLGAEKGSKLSQPKHGRLSEAARRTKDKDPKTTLFQPKKQIQVEDKRAIFAQLAKFKNMDTSTFSRWYLSATQDERAQLRSDYNTPLART